MSIYKFFHVIPIREYQDLCYFLNTGKVKPTLLVFQTFLLSKQEHDILVKTQKNNPADNYCGVICKIKLFYLLALTSAVSGLAFPRLPITSTI